MSGAGAPVRIGILGDLVASRAGAELDLGGPRQRAVLALLVLARGDVVPADRLVDALWGDSPPPSAVGTLHSSVSRLRSRLQQRDLIARQGPGYRLAVDREAVDAWRFERLLQEAAGADAAGRVALLGDALALWRGPALAEYATEDWAQPEATRLAGLREVARDQLLAARLDLGRADVLVPELERLVADDPLREERWRLLALALYRAHRQADALAALRRARDTLADELGVDPGPALRALEGDILAQSPALDARPPADPATRPAARAAVPAQRPGAPAAPDGLVERSREVADLSRAVDDAVVGAGRLVVVEGPAGIGKTALLAEARRLGSAGGALVLGSRSSQLEQGYGFGVVRQLFEPALAGADRADLARASGAAQVFDLAEEGAARDAYGLMLGLHRLTSVLAADRPLVLLVDDLQWADPESLRFLAFLARRVEHLPVLVVATLRTGEVHADETVGALLDELLGDVATSTVRPSPLTEDGTAALVGARLGEKAAPAFVRACHRATQGNPLLLDQLLKALHTERVTPDAAHADTVTAIGSRAVAAMVLLRLRRLPEPAGVVARALAVLGDGAGLPEVAGLASLPEAEVTAAVGALARSGLVGEGYPLGFVHPLVREAAYRSVGPGERETAHERAARLLAERGHPPEQVAAHLVHVPHRGDPWVAGVLVEAADRAEARGAVDATIAYLHRAVDEPAPADQLVWLMLRLGWVTGIKRGADALPVLQRAMTLATDPVQRAEVAILLAGVALAMDRPGATTRFARATLAELPAGLTDQRDTLEAVARLAGQLHGLPLDEWRAPDLAAAARRTDLPSRLALTVAWELALRGRDRARAVALAREVLARGDLSTQELFHDIAGMVLDVADAGSPSFWADTIAANHSSGGQLEVGTWLWQGHLLWRHGRLAEAAEALRTARVMTQQWGAGDFGVPYCDALLVRVALDEGDVAAARAQVDEGLRRGGQGEGPRMVLEAQVAVLLAEGDPVAALRAADAVPADPALANPAWYRVRALRAQALAALGRTDEALVLADADLAAAREWGASDTLARCLRLVADLRGGVSGEAAAREAVDLLADHPARLERARAQVTLARCLAAGAEQQRLLHSAIALADTCGAAGLRAEVAAALSALGIDVPAAPAPVARLTPAQRTMAARWAAGADPVDLAAEAVLPIAVVDELLEHVRAVLGASEPGEVAAALS